MKRKALLLSVVSLASITLALQLPPSLAHTRQTARSPIAQIPSPEASTVVVSSSSSVTSEGEALFGSASRPPVFPQRRKKVAKKSVSSQSSVAPSSAPYLIMLSEQQLAVPRPLAALDDPSIDAHHRVLAEAVLGMLPGECQRKLQSFYLIENMEHRGLAGRGVIMVRRNLPDKEFVAILLHEGLGHFQDLTCIDGTGGPASPFRDGGTPVLASDPSAAFYLISWKNNTERVDGNKKEDHVTGYARTGGPFEDLAESVTYYITSEDAFRARAAVNQPLARKLAWLESYMPKERSVAVGEPWTGTIAWDATKMPFTWLGASTGL